MPANRFYFLLLVFLLALLGYLTYGIMSPFLNAIAWSVVFSIVFYPIYAFLKKYLKLKSLASAVTVLLIIIIIVGPVTYLTIMLVNELQVIAGRMNQNEPGSLSAFVSNLKSLPIFYKIRSYLGIDLMFSEEAVQEGLKKLGRTLMENLSLKIPNMISAAVDFLFMVFTVYFLFKDGPGFLSRVKNYMPFNEVQKERLASQIKDMIVSTVYGGVVIAIIQGILGGAAFFFLQIESPVLWGVAMSIMSFVPLVGTFAIWGPTSVYLFIQGDYSRGAELFLFGVFVISMVDNILKPLIIGSRTKIHTVVILFSVLGGIKLFGLIGLIMGPLITAVFISVFDITIRLGEEERG